MHDETHAGQPKRPASDGPYVYDVFISYSSKDKGWVRGPLLERLEAEGVRACIDFRDFRPGVPSAEEIERAVLTSRFTLVILTPQYLTSGWTRFERLMRQTLDASAEEYRLIPLLKESCTPPVSISYLTHVDFTDSHQEGLAWQRLLTRLDPGYAGKQLDHTPADVVPGPAPLPPGSRMPLSANPLFVGRDDELRELARVLKVGDTAAIGQIAAATGLGGIGKTQLTAEFVHRYGQFFVGGVFWLSFADPAAVPAEVAACGGVEGMRLSPDFRTLPLDDQVQLVLAEWQRSLPRLLVFDNCEDEALLDAWRPKHGGCRVLVTSRRAEWDVTLGVCPVPLGVLPRPQSMTLLRAFRPDLAEDDADLDAIAAELGDLPLALHLAGSFLTRYQQDLTAAEYLDELRLSKGIAHESLEGAGISPTKHDLSVARTFRLSYERLDVTIASDALALAILARMAYFAPGELIPRDLLRATVELPSDEPYTNRRITRGVRRLVSLGLLDEEVDGAVRVHRLVVAFVRAVMTDVTAQAAVEQIILAMARTLNTQGYPAPLLVLQGHLRAITHAAVLRQDVDAAALCNEFGYHLVMIGAYWEAQGYFEQSLAITQRVLGPNHPDTASSLNNLGNVLDNQGRYSEAQGYFEQALAIYQRVLGPDHPDTAVSLNNLGNVLDNQGRSVEAQGYFEQALALRQRVLGPDHPDTASSLNNLGNVLNNQGRYPEAQGYYEQALAIYQRVLGPDHPDTAMSLNNLGLVLNNQGRSVEAQGYYEQALAIYQRVLGPDHPDTAMSLNNLGSVLDSQGRYPEAQGYFEQALALRQRVLGPDHPDTASSLNNLGSVLDSQGRSVEAQGYFEQALALRQRVLGPNHPDTAMSFNNLGLVLNNQGRYPEAQGYFEQALAIYQRVLGPDHPTTRIIGENLARFVDQDPEP